MLFNNLTGDASRRDNYNITNTGICGTSCPIHNLNSIQQTIGFLAVINYLLQVFLCITGMDNSTCGIG